MAEPISHRMPESIRRVAKGEYEVKGTALRIVQGDDGKWTVQGHSDNLGAFGSRGATLAKLQELGLVPEVPAEQPADEAKQPERQNQPEADGKRPTGRKPRTRKEPAKAGA